MSTAYSFMLGCVGFFCGSLIITIIINYYFNF